jgi:O-antigen ligase
VSNATSTQTNSTHAIAAPPVALCAHNAWLAIYVAVLVGKFAEWVPWLTGVPVARIAIAFTLWFAWRARGALPPVRVRSLPIARAALPFFVLAIVSLVFSVYKSKSLAESYGIAICLISFVLLLKVTQTLRDVERLLGALCIAAAGLAVAIVFSYHGGRATLNQSFDPNDLAYGLVTVFPVIHALAVVAKKTRRLLLHALSVVALIAIALTGSRGGAISLAVVVLLLVAFPVTFAKSGVLKRFQLGRFVAVLAVIAALGTVLWGFLPAESRAQMATLLDLKNDYNTGSAAGSRTAIWSRDLAQAWKRPIGYGIGSSEFVNGVSGGGYHVAHNSYLQSFVELGIPGFVLFCASYLVTLRQLRRVSGLAWRSAPAGEAAKASLYARALRIALAGNLVAAFFLSQAYAPLLWVLIAICAALVRISLPGEVPATTPLRS